MDLLLQRSLAPAPETSGRAGLRFRSGGRPARRQSPLEGSPSRFGCLAQVVFGFRVVTRSHVVSRLHVLPALKVSAPYQQPGVQISSQECRQAARAADQKCKVRLANVGRISVGPSEPNKLSGRFPSSSSQRILRLRRKRISGSGWWSRELCRDLRDRAQWPDGVRRGIGRTIAGGSRR